jgi:eukaryotic-like serine/threonine-protein kinase
MLEANPVLVSLVEAIADGLPIDWSSTDAADLTPEDRRLVAELRVLERLHTLHRRQGASPGTGLPQADITTTTAEPRSTWGHLQIKGILGTGGFGVVFRAWDPRLASEVALKVLARDTGIGEAVIAEASLLARVRHPNIVSIYGADRHNGEVGLWMELIRGRTLSEIVRTQGTFGAREAALVALDLTRALATVHGAGLLHRDVKAQNVMREEGGRIVLMDFGAGVESAGASRLKIVGTPLYIAPEQLDRPESTPQSDIYSLGVLLYHIVTGSYPIAADSLSGAEVAHRLGQRKRLRDVRPDLPTEFVQIVERAMHPDVRERYRTAGELESALAHFVVRDEVQTGSTRRGTKVDEPRWRRAVIAWLAAVAALVAAGIAAWLFLHSSSSIRPPTSAAGLQSLAVLPFTNNSGDPAQEYFVDGVTDLLTNRLSSISSLRVISRTSAMSFKGVNKPLAQIAAALNVDAIVEGSVTRDGERVRVTVQIIHAGTDVRLWGNSYERETTDTFRLQAEMARTIANELRAVFTERTQRSVNQTLDAKPQAQEWLLRGRYLMDSRNRDRLKEARTLLERAVDLDPNFALAWATLARCYTMLENTGVLTSVEAASLATRAANEALSRDPDAFEAHVALADVLFKFDWKWVEADAHYRQAIDANGSSSFARGQYAQFLNAAGLLDDAERQARRGELADPLSAGMKIEVAVALYYQKRYQQALDKASEALSLDPNLPIAHVMRARALSGLGRGDGAIAEIQRSYDLTKDPAALAELGRILAAAGRTGEAESILSRITAAGLDGVGASLGEAYIEAALGRRQEAIASLARAVQQRSSRVLWMRVDPRVDSLRTTPEFQNLLREIGGLEPAPR